MKDSMFQSEYTKSVNSIALPENYKEKILSALRMQDKEQNEENKDTNTEIIEFTQPDKAENNQETNENPFDNKTIKSRTNFRRFVPATACAAAAIVIITSVALLFALNPFRNKEITFDFSISSATNLASISGARVVFRDRNGELVKNDEGETLTAYTDENGSIRITLPSDEEYTAEITAGGYIPLQTTLKNEYIYISPIMNEDTYRAVLTWEEDYDLDAILTAEKDGEKEQVFYFKGNIKDESGQVIAALDTDSITPDAPETITFNATQDTVFRFSVASYAALEKSDITMLSASGAQVTLYKGDKLVGKYKVPSNTSGNAWCVFEVNNSGLEVRNEFYTIDSIINVK